MAKNNRGPDAIARRRKAATLAMMERSMEAIREGRTKPAEQALREIAERLGLSLKR